VKFQPMATAPTETAILLLLGETIPDLAHVMVGSFVTHDQAEQCGEQVGINGGWMIWHDGADWYCVELYEPLGWFPLPDTSDASGMRLAHSTDKVIEA
jgi:hypothetical protein